MKTCLAIFYCVTIVLLFFIEFIDNATFRCDYEYSEALNGWSKYYAIPATWNDARLRCGSQGAILASPTTPEMLRLMLQKARNDNGVTANTQLFTDFHSTFTQGEFYTVGGNLLSEFNYKWAEGQPDNLRNQEKCLTLNMIGELSDTNCGDPHPYMCFKPNTPETTTNECGTTDPGYNLDSRTNQCYKFHIVPRNFSRASLVCSAEGGHLAIINSEQEAQVLKELFATIDPSVIKGNIRKDLAFIGFYDWGERSDWRTIHGETLDDAGYAKFIKDEPNNCCGGEYCGSIDRSALLNDLGCDFIFPFICEKSPDFPKVCYENGTTITTQQVEKYSRY